MLQQKVSAKETVIIKNIEYEVCECCGKPKRGTGKTVGGTAFFICKDFVRAKKIVPFCEQWMKLCESCGFETTHWIRAWQVKELGTQLALDGNHKTKKIERKSFFRRLAEKNNPSVRIDYEVIIVMRKVSR